MWSVYVARDSAQKIENKSKRHFKLVYLSGLNISQALGKAATMKFGAPAREFLDFVANAKSAAFVLSNAARAKRRQSNENQAQTLGRCAQVAARARIQDGSAK